MIIHDELKAAATFGRSFDQYAKRVFYKIKFNERYGIQSKFTRAIDYYNFYLEFFDRLQWDPNYIPEEFPILDPEWLYPFGRTPPNLHEYLKKTNQDYSDISWDEDTPSDIYLTTV
ncbi:unnamed protein product [Bursaphelenchus okinawaensis]|uniref:Uncharacterized protein n=1 Tax=Bursaphelenchus okinawaensis TaxID=465554 RepID=A0A811JRS3_9BILA|nr:unnamed protein product [Bursaphelenchus okinawaensis]CAG9080078.1 unnamed protein product [Bursaphelenchus okinawaensis]